jgi:hypothetical protein
MSKLFILGAGFSRAFSREMPLMNGLAKCIRPELRKFGKNSVYRKFGNDVEGLMSYLYEEIPWRPDYDSKHDEGLLLKLLDRIGEYVAECEEEAFKKEPPEWANKFIEYIHKKKLTVATFNYDTILERLSKDLKMENIYAKLEIYSIYRIPITSLMSRTGNNMFSHQEDTYHQTYRLIKLHGSINWYLARDVDFPVVPVYYKDVYEHYYLTDYQEEKNELIRRNMMGLKPLIIPPVAEKSSFYGNQLVKILWAELKKAVDDADEICCVGYSLPKSDYTTQTFFKTLINKVGRKVYVVNLKSGSDDLIKNYKEALPDCELIKDYITDDEPVKKMVMDLK